jgi:hypothetical protein
MPPKPLPEPPPPPDAPRHIKLYRYQWIGVAALSALPLLAIAGLFGETRSVSEARGGSIEAVMRFSTRVRNNQIHRIEVRVRNLSGANLDTVHVSLDSAFAGRFAEIRAIPELERPFDIALSDVPANGVSSAVIELRGKHSGRSFGTLTVAAAADTLRMPLEVLVYP